MDSKEPKKKKTLSWAWLLLLLLLLLFWWQSHLKQVGEAHKQKQIVADSLAQESALKRKDSLLQISLDSIKNWTDSITADSMAKVSSISSFVKMSSSSQTIVKPLSSFEMKNQPKLDSIPPTGFVVPIGGRYFDKVALTFTCDEPDCNSEYSLLDTNNPIEAKKIDLAESKSIFYRFKDSLGNTSNWKKEIYVIKPKNSLCPKNMVFVEGSPSYCIDKYEWPNQKGEYPMTSVSLQKAKVSCEEIGKKLCSLEQWQGACIHKGSRYSYGNEYVGRYCNSSGSRPKRSGFKKNCRSWGGAFDLSGNVWEWTSTPHKKRKTFVYVAGGNWASQDGATCKAAKYSFYPQNEYPMVGFRCCGSALKEK